MDDASKPYAVNYWGSHPDEDNDDCWTGTDHATLEEARAAFDAGVPAAHSASTAFVELNGPGVREVRANPDYSPREDSDDDSDRRVLAMEAGLLGGCDAWNAVMGFDTNDYSDDVR